MSCAAGLANPNLAWEHFGDFDFDVFLFDLGNANGYLTCPFFGHEFEVLFGCARDFVGLRRFYTVEDRALGLIENQLFFTAVLDFRRVVQVGLFHGANFANTCRTTFSTFFATAKFFHAPGLGNLYVVGAFYRN